MMATYFNGSSEIQADHLQMLYLMNSSCAATSYSHAAQQHLVGIPLPHFGSGTLGPDLIRPSSFHEIQGSTAAAGPRFSLSELGSPMGIRGASKQGLFLSLNNSSMVGAVLSPGAGGGSPQSVILGSNYLKATQELLDEVVSMADTRARGAHKEKAKAKMEIASDDEDAYGSSNGSVKKGGVSGELSSAQRQELQMKKAKLLNMLDEVEQRYKQYQIQMHRVGSALEQAAGAGSAKSYTSLAFHTISKQFRCLKDAIASQVKETGRRMGEEADDKEGGKTSTRLRMVEQQLRQQRAMQQIGMMHSQHPAWRRQRGLPRRAVSVLRAWLFEHFLHPYPKDSDKHTLAKQTGLTRSQVSNWFINARVRLWKPMVEEMYVEEMKVTVHCQKDSDGANTTTTNNNNYPSKAYSSLTQKSTPLLQSYNRISEPNLSPPPPNNSIINDIPNPTLVSQSLNRTKPTLHTIGPEFSLIRSSSSGMESILIQRSPKHQRSSVRDIHSPSNKDLVTTPNVRFGSSNYPVDNHIGSRLNLDHHHNQQLGQSRYNHASNAVSLTLGLPHCENLLSLSRAHQQQKIFFSGQAMQLDRMLDMGEPEWCGSQPDAHSGVDGSGYEGSIDMQTGKRFEAQPLPDFVA